MKEKAGGRDHPQLFYSAPYLNGAVISKLRERELETLKRTFRHLERLGNHASEMSRASTACCWMQDLNRRRLYLKSQKRGRGERFRAPRVDFPVALSSPLPCYFRCQNNSRMIARIKIWVAAHVLLSTREGKRSEPEIGKACAFALPPPRRFLAIEAGIAERYLFCARAEENASLTATPLNPSRWNRQLVVGATLDRVRTNAL